MARKREAGTLRCPGCGANVAPDVQRCPYCTARLATISCPSCFALMFDTAAYCQACGARRVRAAEDDASARCPGCRKDMQRVSIGGTVLLECHACDGVWLDAADFERICATTDAQSAVLHHVQPRQAVRTGEIVRYRRCLRCRTMMNRVNFGQVSGTIVDVCRGHGTFLDAGELHTIVTFIRGGGLDAARKRRIEELKEEERRLERKQFLAGHQGRVERSWAFEDGMQLGGGLLDLLDLLRRD